ncbi:hypothetical protein Emin_0656 [Elusimicrobium minutum Pei191]|uniref:DUF177 domain-containing protein n=1 Tax=Elusimicrobium minutum (strain Pei191) TaxID=445932 RepID=B2KC84_ELUMP|nr:DUF177 domain-containing protein [Elusimicrobium minutum]ACC98211.1 hypothetical protein Emin_0656 [Elusimicrobium minutum Pei191]
MNYADYDVPEDLVFRTKDIIRMKGLKCSAKLAPKDFENILSEPNKITSVKVNLNFSISQKDILVQGRVYGATKLQCGRCLDIFDGSFDEEFIETYSIKSEIIDIMYEVIQTLALIESITFVCDENCKGLCDQCGKNKNKENCGCVRQNFSAFAVLKKDK